MNKVNCIGVLEYKQAFLTINQNKSYYSNAKAYHMETAIPCDNQWT